MKVESDFEAQERVEQLALPIFPIVDMTPRQVQALHADVLAATRDETAAPLVALRRDLGYLACHNHEAGQVLLEELSVSQFGDDRALAVTLLGPLLASAKDEAERFAVRNFWVELLLDPDAWAAANAALDTHRELIGMDGLIEIANGLIEEYQLEHQPHERDAIG